ncbi:TIGR01212 family radical SAM protein [uncultured Anaerococcus sp.]|uniref:TIGR01212 family radical SAM protein n=1 Tax=uncultured Anaerococcus sp. TaxID=293428 RepID=UPI002803A0E8|nr:TIGR01212 family radical SAM protein [uncultured Anaerococcus sp.]
MRIEINKKRYRDYDSYMKEKVNKKIIKLPLDGGFTCPNRDGTISKEGCIFCSESGSGEWTFGKKSIREQISHQKERLSKEGRPEAYLGYFQNFTNTYGDISRLRKLYHEALEACDIIGLAIATRADCLSDQVLDLLEEINDKYFLIVELGMQSVNDKTLSLINRGYDQETFDSGLKKLKARGIRVLVHMIVGLPFEGYDDYMKTISYINEAGPWGIKIHNLYVEKNSKLEKFYRDNNLVYGMDREAYVDLVVEILRKLRPEIVINRLTGDGIGDKIAFPLWSKNKAKILTSIDKMMKDKNYRQGDLWKEN